jgi:putative transcriptional regulator
MKKNFSASTEIHASPGYLTGKLLAAMPFNNDPRFQNVLVFICGHDNQGAIGLIINKPFPSLSFVELLTQLGIGDLEITHNVVLHSGGPVEVSRGFILHTRDYALSSTVIINEQFSMTSTLEILKKIAQGDGPKEAIVSLGYTGWSKGQLEQEILDNTWIIVDATENLIFKTNNEDKWHAALGNIGVNPGAISLEYGHA